MAKKRKSKGRKTHSGAPITSRAVQIVEPRPDPGPTEPVPAMPTAVEIVRNMAYGVAGNAIFSALQANSPALIKAARDTVEMLIYQLQALGVQQTHIQTLIHNIASNSGFELLMANNNYYRPYILLEFERKMHDDRGNLERLINLMEMMRADLTDRLAKSSASRDLLSDEGIGRASSPS